MSSEKNYIYRAENKTHSMHYQIVALRMNSQSSNSTIAKHLVRKMPIEKCHLVHICKTRSSWSWNFAKIPHILDKFMLMTGQFSSFSLFLSKTISFFVLKKAVLRTDIATTCMPEFCDASCLQHASSQAINDALNEQRLMRRHFGPFRCSPYVFNRDGQSYCRICRLVM